MKTWQLVLRLIAWSPGRFALATGAAAAVFTLPVAAGLVLRAFLNALSGGGAAGAALWTVVAWFVAVEVGQIVAGGALSFGWITALQTSMALLRRNLLAVVVWSYGAFYRLDESPAAALSRFRDDAEEIVESVDAWIDLAGRTVFMGAALTVLLRINAGLTVAVLAPLVAIVAAVNLTGARVRRYRSAAQRATGEATGFLGDMLAAWQAIHVASAAPHVLRRFQQLGEGRRRASLLDATFAQLIGAFYLNAASVSTGVLLLLAGRAMHTGTFSVGDFALFALYLPEVATYGDEIARWLTGYRQASVSVGRMAALTPGGRPESLVAHGASFLTVKGDAAEAADGPRSAPGDMLPSAGVGQHHPASDTPRCSTRGESLGTLETLELRGVVVTHRDGEHAVGPVSLVLRRGTLTVITGQIGAGKSALLEALLGLRPLTSGHGLWNGVPLDPALGDLAPPSAGYTSQAPRLLSDTLRENVLLGAPVDEAGLGEALHLAVMEQDVVHLEHGLDTVVGPRGVRLSGGQVQRAAAARMLVRRPDLLVLDDLSSALDTETERQLWDRLLSIPSRPAILAVSHRRLALERADQVVVLDHGHIHAQGAFGELQRETGYSP